jgi:hypothetical protein
LDVDENDHDVIRREQAIDLERLATAWHLFATATDLEEVPIHIHPAMDVFRDRIVDMVEEHARNHPKVASGEADAEDVLTSSFKEMLVSLFKFGQFCAMLPHPILYDKMTPCVCGTLTDNDISELLRRE